MVCIAIYNCFNEISLTGERIKTKDDNSCHAVEKIDD